ncbi:MULTISPECIES: ABC transporter ATP-binding protein [Methanobacterium]|uniref:ABC transporter ATP-binding protein n=1 Tax=Methanobacterium subterraneum TaxID=59277 RepID=A0A2H4VSK3_9EURY|nr:iron ABC transporter ATP-binding protein [Methanobacterium sp. MZ-A1]AUB61057.1 iron ABC transporter ATP-binding protein [Methanobacterium subterraneum]NMO09204.1 ABC transporter ATP-binding protein [Methanobacterium subterraneum]
MKPIMEIKGCSFAYDNNENIFEDINFSVSSGDIFCILGANGTGKTTLIKCLTGLMSPHSGEINIDGQDMNSFSRADLAKKIGYIPQIHNSTFPFTVLDVVLMGRSPHLDMFESPSEKDYEIALKSLKSLNIEHMKDKPYTEISGGEQQLVFIARVLTQEPSILILDEPTSHLDFGNQIRTLNIIKQLASNGLSVIMSSHFPDHAFISANKVALMDGKKFMAIGKPEDVITTDNMKRIYGIDVKVMDIGKRMACIP